MSQHKVVVYVPLDYADIVRKTIGEAGSGRLGEYSFCSFSTRGVGRFLPSENANPHIGEVNKLEEVEEERVEVTCDTELVENVLSAIKKVHPYEEIAMDVWPLEER